jgi:ferritin-like metal-binding protein YciE
MSTPENLQDLYIDELKDLWSANDQMLRCLKKIASKISDKSLKDLVVKSQQGITEHTDILKALIASNGEKVSKEHCKGMEGLVAEATKHTTEEAPEKGPVLDAVIIAQYQRMTHYGIAGFGTAAAYAMALGLKDDQKKLTTAVKQMYDGDGFMNKLSDTVVNIEAKDEA